MRGHAASRLVVSLCAVAVALLAITGPAAAVAPAFARFSVTYGDCAVGGQGPASTAISVTWKDSDGALKLKQSLKTKRGGSFSTRCDFEERVERGDTITVKAGTRSRTLTVPRLALWYDRVADTIQGRGPADSELDLAIDTVTTDGAGSFLLDLTGEYDIRGGDYFGVEYATPQGDRVSRYLETPSVRVTRGRPEVWILGRPGRLVEVQLLDGSLSARASVECRLPWDGWCPLMFIDDEGHSIRVAAGDTVRALDLASDAEFVVPAVTVSGTPATDVIKGSCENQSEFSLEATPPDYSDYVDRYGTTKADGSFSRDVTSDYDLRSGDRVTATCWLDTGDQVLRQAVLP